MRFFKFKSFLIIPFLIGILFLLNPTNVKAEETSATQAKSLTFTINNSSTDTGLVTDNSYTSAVKYYGGTSVNVTSESEMYGIYIKWYHNPSTPYTISYGDTVITCGNEGFLHEYIQLDTPTTTLNINLSEDIKICEVEVFSNGTLPSDVQVWNPVSIHPDILVFSTHADDEILFLGGVLATYGARDDITLQVAYMCDFYLTEPYREHEELDGLWEIGLNIYPVKGSFYDYYCGNYDAALSYYDYDEVCSYVTSTIRKFKPLIVVTQDFNGEYGHGAHQLLVKCVADAVDNSNDASFYPESANEYGTYDVPKTYMHLYSENAITLDLRTNLSYLGNRSALQASKDAYLRHVSQQYCWFYVDDEYEYSCAKFGLYRSLVGNDTTNDILCNITTYEEQAAIDKVNADANALSNSAYLADSMSMQISTYTDELTEYKTNTITPKQVIVTFIAIIIISIVIISQAMRHKKEYIKKVEQYKKENDIK